MNAADLGRTAWVRVLALMGRPQSYTIGDGTEAQLLTAMHGVWSERNLFGAAQQGDRVAVVDAQAFAAAFPTQPTPRRFDRVQVAGLSFSVEEWRPAPDDGAPVVFRLLLR